MSVLLFFIRSNSTYLHKMINTSKKYGRMRWIVVKYVLESSQGSIHGGRRFWPCVEGGCIW